ncbi:MAG: hypothetical protein QXO32_08895 [Candidatus Bathyarchaeia archaeon]
MSISIDSVKKGLIAEAFKYNMLVNLKESGEREMEKTQTMRVKP